MESMQQALPEVQVLRPGQGTLGKRVPIQVNAFAAKIPEVTVHHYDVAIISKAGGKPGKHGQDTSGKLASVDASNIPPRVGREIFNHLEGNLDAFSGLSVVYDGRKNIFAPKRIPNWAMDEAFFEVDIAEEGERPRSFSVKITKVNEVHLNALHHFLSGAAGPTADEGVLMSINALNVLVNHNVFMRHPSASSKFYPSPYANQQPDYLGLSGGLHLWRGYFSSLRVCPRSNASQGLLLNFDITSAPFYASGNGIEIAIMLAGVRNDPRALLSLNGRQRLDMERGFKALKVRVVRDDGKTFSPKKVHEVSRVGAKALTFDKDGSKVTVHNYFRQTHNVNLRYPDLPCLRLSAKAWYPLELCEVPKGQKYPRRLSPEQLATAIKWQTVEPQSRMNRLLAGLRENYHPSISRAMVDWGMKINPNPLQATARLLEAPKIVLKDPKRKVDSPFPPRDGTWNMSSKHVCRPGRPVANWMVIVFSSPSRFFGEQDLQLALRHFVQGLTNTGLSINPNPFSVTWAGKTRNELHPHANVGEYLKAQRPKGVGKPDLVVCFFDDKNAWQYQELKVFGDVRAATATQGLDISKAKVKDPNRGNPQYYGNVGLKVNAKLGGSNHLLGPQDMGPVFRAPTMIFGADVTHPTPDSASPSIAGVVASTSREGMGYHAEFSVQPARVEMITELDVMAQSLIKRFQAGNGNRLPQNIIFYRDGVSEGQFKTVLSDEIPLLRRAFRTIDRNWSPKLTFLVCGKRHHFKFSPMNAADADRSGNLKAGAVVDTDIVHPFEFDWYCQSHAGLLGTSRSAHYTVLVDDNKLSADVLQRLTFNLCFLYSRATRSVSIATPAYYAHHVCTRAKLWLWQSEGDESTMISGSSGVRLDAESMMLKEMRARAANTREMFRSQNETSVEFWM